MNRWTDNENSSHYYYDEKTGKILGSTHKIHSNIVWVAKIATSNPAEEYYLGHYISADFGKKAVESFLDQQSRTLTHE